MKFLTIVMVLSLTANLYAEEKSFKSKTFNAVQKGMKQTQETVVKVGQDAGRLAKQAGQETVDLAKQAGQETVDLAKQAGQETVDFAKQAGQEAGQLVIQGANKLKQGVENSADLVVELMQKADEARQAGQEFLGDAFLDLAKSVAQTARKAGKLAKQVGQGTVNGVKQAAETTQEQAQLMIDDIRQSKVAKSTSQALRRAQEDAVQVAKGIKQGAGDIANGVAQIAKQAGQETVNIAKDTYDIGKTIVTTIVDQTQDLAYEIGQALDQLQEQVQDMYDDFADFAWYKQAQAQDAAWQAKYFFDDQVQN